MSCEPVQHVTASERYQVSNIMRCPRCGQTGVVRWEKNAHANSNESVPQLISISDEFYERVARKAPYRIEIVCQRCDTVQAA